MPTTTELLAVADSSFGERLKAIREAAGLTRYRLSIDSGVSQTALMRIERGEHDPNWTTVMKLAAALGVEVGQFAPPEPTEQPTPPEQSRAMGKRK